MEKMWRAPLGRSIRKDSLSNSASNEPMSLPGLNLCMYVYIYIFQSQIFYFVMIGKKKSLEIEWRKDWYVSQDLIHGRKSRKEGEKGRKEEDLPELDARKVRVAIFIERDPSGSPVTEVVVSRGSRLVSALRPG